MVGGDISLDYTTDPDTRQLSITSIAGTNVTQGPTQSLLLYEDSSGNVATLLQVQEPEPGQGSYWLDVSRKDDSIPRSDFSPVYFDGPYGPVSSTLHESVPGANLRAPFVSWPSTYLYESGAEAGLILCDISNDGNFTNKREFSLCNSVIHITYQSWANASRGFFTRTSEQYDFAESNSLIYPSIRSFDFAYLNTDEATMAVWVNGTNVYPISVDEEYSGKVVPQVSFPFTRLASINLPGKSCYLYHQINDTTLAEEQYDFSLHEWLTTDITVPHP